MRFVTFVKNCQKCRAKYGILGGFLLTLVLYFWYNKVDYCDSEKVCFLTEFSHFLLPKGMDKNEQ